MFQQGLHFSIGKKEKNGVAHNQNNTMMNTSEYI